jgi:EAL domain-containing protein (putative c-di-GMP-specific phosphodiesterase class I)/CheY-like chemotaxis protein
LWITTLFEEEPKKEMPYNQIMKGVEMSEAKILVVDDEPDALEMLKFRLDKEKFQVITASQGIEALERAAREQPSLILLDVLMPGLSGYEVCQRLKAREETKAIPIIMLTVRAETESKIEALNMGADDYITKPFEIKELVARIRVALRRGGVKIRPDDQAKEERLKELRRIIDERDVSCLFQPVVHFPSRSIFGYEALTRGPQGSDLADPTALFTLAEEAGMVFELERVCREKILRAAKDLPPTQVLFLNLNPRLISDPRSKEGNLFKSRQIGVGEMVLEITERTAIKDFESFRKALERLKILGIRVAIDDTGSGYSSLQAIAELKPEFLKLDMSIVRDIDKDEIKQSLVETILHLSRNMGGLAIGEGIERVEEYRTLSDLGVEYGQGYLFARPAQTFPTPTFPR